MRWFVDVGTIGKPDKQSHCVEAESWQKALQAVRAVRADIGSMGGFSIELLEDGCRAVDPLARLRYELRRAPDSAPLTSQPKTIADGPASLPPSTLPAPTTQTPAKVVLPVLSRRDQEHSPSAPITFRERAYLVPPGTRDEDAAADLVVALAQIQSEIAGAPQGKLIQLAAFDIAWSGRPSSKPLATLTWKDWREPHVVGLPRRAHATPAQSFRVAADVAPPRPVAPEPRPAPVAAPAATAYAPPAPQAAPPPAQQPTRVAGAPTAAPEVTTPPAPFAAEEVPTVSRAMASSRPSGTGRTARPTAPSWPAPTPAPSSTVAFSPPAPATATPASPPSPPAAAPIAAIAVPSAVPLAAPPAAPPVAPAPVAFAPAPSAPEPVVSLPAPLPAPPVPVLVQAPQPGKAIEATPTLASPPAAAAPKAPEGAPVSLRAVRKPRGHHDDLLADLFEAASDLPYMTDAVTAADFCAALSHEKLEADACIVHIYNINRREFVSTAGRGDGTDKVVGIHHNESDPMLSSAMRRRRPVVLTGAEIAAGSRGRLAPLGDIKSMIIAPVMQSGRFLGAIELFLTVDGGRFSETDSNGLGYIAEQLAEFLGARGVGSDSERAQPVARQTR